MSPETVELCRNVDLSDLPAERIWGEMEKLLLQAQHPSVGLEWLHKLGAIEKLFPEIQSLIGVPQDPEWHPEGDVFVHTKLVVDRARELIDDLSYPRQVTVMLAALAHDFGSRLQLNSLTADCVRAGMRKRACRRPRVFSIVSMYTRSMVTTCAGRLSRSCGNISSRVSFTRSATRLVRERFGVWRVDASRIFCIAWRRPIRSAVMLMGAARTVVRCGSSGMVHRAHEGIASGATPARSFLLGRHLFELGVEPGPQMGEITRAVYEMQLDGRVRTLDEAINEARKIIDPR